MQCIGWAGTNAGQTPNALFFNNHDGAFFVAPSFGIGGQRKQCFKRAMIDAQVTAGARILRNGHHGLTHARPS